MKKCLSTLLMAGVLTASLTAGVSQLSANESHVWADTSNCYDGFNSCGYNGCCESNLAIWADFLWWDACQDNLDIAIIDSSNAADSDGSSGVTIVDGETKFFEYRYKPGFRVGASYRLPCENLSIDFVYTMWHPKQHHTYTAPIGGTLDSTQLPSFFAGGAYTEANAELKTKYELYDLLLSTTYCCDNFKARPYFGARVLWFRQKLESVLTPVSFENNAGYSSSLWRTEIPAGGITLGVEGKYHLCAEWSLTGRVGASLLGGRSKQHNQWFTPSPVETTPNTASAGSHTEHRHHCQVISGWDAAIGFAYDWCCCGTPVGVSVGYEIQDWFNVAQRPRFVNSSGGNTTIGAIEQVTEDASSRFTVHGLYVRAGIAF